MNEALAVAREEAREDGREEGREEGREVGREEARKELFALWEKGVPLAEAKKIMERQVSPFV